MVGCCCGMFLPASELGLVYTPTYCVIEAKTDRGALRFATFAAVGFVLPYGLGIVLGLLGWLRQQWTFRSMRRSLAKDAKLMFWLSVSWLTTNVFLVVNVINGISVPKDAEQDQQNLGAQRM